MYEGVLTPNHNRTLVRNITKFTALKNVQIIGTRIHPRNFSPVIIKAHLPPKDQQPCFSRNKTGCTKISATCFVTPMWLTVFDAKRKNNSGKASQLFFRFAIVLRALFKLASGFAYM